MSEAVDLLALAALVDLWHLLLLVLLVLLVLLLLLVGVLLLGLFLLFLRGTERVDARAVMKASRRPRSFATLAPDLLGLGLGRLGFGRVGGIFLI